MLNKLSYKLIRENNKNICKLYQFKTNNFFRPINISKHVPKEICKNKNSVMKKVLKLLFYNNSVHP